MNNKNLISFLFTETHNQENLFLFGWTDDGWKNLTDEPMTEIERVDPQFFAVCHHTPENENEQLTISYYGINHYDLDPNGDFHAHYSNDYFHAFFNIEY